MKSKNCLPVILVLIVLGALVVYFPPGKFSWHTFFADQAPAGRKLSFLLKVYAAPACLSFCAVVLFQVQMRMSLGGAPVHVIFPLSILGATSMLGAFRTMVAGVGGVPGYALGMATAYTMMSRFYAVRPSGRTLFGKPMVRIVWRGDPEAARDAQMVARRQLQAMAPKIVAAAGHEGRRPGYPPSPQFNFSSNISNS
jgi:hypothetical protein